MAPLLCRHGGQVERRTIQFERDYGVQRLPVAWWQGDFQASRGLVNFGTTTRQDAAVHDFRRDWRQFE